MADPDRDGEDDVPDGPDYLWDRTGAPDPELARLEALLSPLAHDAPLKLPADVVPISHPRRRRWPIVASAGIAAAAAVIALVVIKRRGGDDAGCDRGDGFAFSADAAIHCDGGRGSTGTLAVGGWIETAAGTARIEVANIGAVELRPQSRLALRGTSATEHRLALEHGALHARVTAPPRLFVIETPSATAIDLGCEYDLVVGPDGGGSLCVITGQVELAGPAGTLVVVPAGTCAAFAKQGLGLPVRTAATPEMRAAVAAFDPARPATVQAIVSAAGDGDQITLINLLALAGPYQREAVYDPLQQLAPTPEDVVKDAIIAGDPESLQRWRDSVVDGWMLSQWCLPHGDGKTDPHGPDQDDQDDGRNKVPPMPPEKARDPSGWGPQ